ncbi:MAG: prepilin-type N-terminal cleavage/methylation domain-containing protein [Alphaproteobacteria bacterium]|nr:prepilin-type N-terminal cleavage/methylation domain-containing protein [Alphaproteobacteria bacterium]
MTNIRSEKGFTLVELAVVMIIIGLLIGGVLKGQELIKSAKVTSTISQVKGIDAATSTFQDIYAGLPGDLASPGTRLPGCTGNPCEPTGGTVDGRVTATGANAPFVNAAQSTEAAAFFPQLAAADLVSGVTPGTDTFGGNYPAAPVNGGWTASTVLQQADIPGASGAEVNDFRPGLYLYHAGQPSVDTASASDSLTMQRMDRKIDDGNPLTGSVYATEITAGECVTYDASTSVYSNAYDTSAGLIGCNAMIRIQN